MSNIVTSNEHFLKRARNIRNKLLNRTDRYMLEDYPTLAPEQLKDEMEILTPINQQFHAPGNWNRINAWNSFKNKNNFCLFDEDKINSKDLILLNI